MFVKSATDLNNDLIFVYIGMICSIDIYEN